MVHYPHYAKAMGTTGDWDIVMCGHDHTASIQEISKTPGIPSLSKTVQAALEASSCEVDASFMKMSSGAWHDAAVLARQQRSDGSPIPTGMLFIPCKDGKSHSPEEYCSPEQIAKGATVLARAMLRLADE